MPNTAPAKTAENTMATAPSALIAGRPVSSRCGGTLRDRTFLALCQKDDCRLKRHLYQTEMAIEGRAFVWTGSPSVSTGSPHRLHCGSTARAARSSTERASLAPKAGLQEAVRFDASSRGNETPSAPCHAAVT